MKSVEKHMLWVLGLLQVVLAAFSVSTNLLTPRSLQIVVFGGGLLNLIAQYIKANPPDDDGVSVTAKLHWMTVALTAMLIGVILSGCSVMQKLTTPAAQPYIQAAVLVGVTTAETKGISAVQINQICKTALAADQGAGATLQVIASVINTELAKLNLPAGDMAAIQLVEVGIGAYIQQAVGQNANVAQFQATVAQFLNVAIQATGG